MGPEQKRHPVVDANAQDTIKGLEQKILHQFEPPSYISDQGTHFTAHGVPWWAKRHLIRWMYYLACHPQSSGLIGNWNGQFKRWLSKTGREKGMRGLAYTPSEVCAHTEHEGC